MDENTASQPRTPVRVDSLRCLRVRHHAAACTACRDACPRGAISLRPGPAIAAERCDGCGACAGVCPVDALALRGMSLEALLAEAEGRPTTYLCRHAAGGNEARVPCLAFLDAGALLATSGQGKPVTLEAGPCANCPDAANLAIAERAAATANAVLSLYGVEPCVSFQRTRGYTAGETVSRRGLFTLVRRRAEAQLTPDPEPSRGAVARGNAMRDAVRPYRRELLVNGGYRLAGRNLPPLAPPAGLPAAPFFAVAIDEKCNGCGMCLTFCPTRALRAERTQTSVAYAFTVDYCVGCRLCVAVCPRDAVSLRPVVGVPALGESQVLRVEGVRRCANCGAEFPTVAEAQLCRQCTRQQALQDAIRKTLFPPPANPEP